MKHLTLILTLFFSTLMIASPAYADWMKVTESVNGYTFYVDFDRIRTNGGYVYFWELGDYLEPISKTDRLSSKVYYQGDCEVLRRKVLSYSFYKKPMGEGSGYTFPPPEPKWDYPTPNSNNEIILKEVCRRAGL